MLENVAGFKLTYNYTLYIHLSKELLIVKCDRKYYILRGKCSILSYSDEYYFLTKNILNVIYN